MNPPKRTRFVQMIKAKPDVASSKRNNKGSSFCSLFCAEVLVVRVVDGAVILYGGRMVWQGSKSKTCHQALL